ncbi:MAG TPA: MFS transporter [Tepidisphaeraceae bacterium]|jgi:NNP family nitrate/nitrite transporter-like MFS transporter
MTNMTDKATRIRLLDFHTPQMRAFHMSWIAFFACFFAWFGIAPLMAVVREEFHLTPSQIGNLVIASVAITIVARLAIGWLCDRFGPRLTYSCLLILGSLPVMGIGLAREYQTFLLFRLAIGAIGASFVITQHHTSVMFAPNCVGTANATTAGWGNMGGGAAQLIMPLLFAGLMGMGLGSFWSWRIAMIVPGALMLLSGIGYFLLTQDTPQGNLRDLPKSNPSARSGKGAQESFVAVCRDGRVWALAVIYAACFGVEITLHNVAALYFTDTFHVGIAGAGAIVGAFGLLALFARSLGGILSDRFQRRFGMSGRVTLLGVVILVEGALLILFSRMHSLPLAVTGLIVFGLFVHISCGATYAVIPFINRKSIGSVAGIVGAGGNVGAVLSGLLFRGAINCPSALLVLGVLVTASSGFTLFVNFSDAADTTATAADSGFVPATALDAST